jgi:hypothetical protein
MRNCPMQLSIESQALSFNPQQMRQHALAHNCALPTTYQSLLLSSSNPSIPWNFSFPERLGTLAFPNSLELWLFRAIATGISPKHDVGSLTSNFMGQYNKIPRNNVHEMTLDRCPADRSAQTNLPFQKKKEKKTSQDFGPTQFQS